MIIPDHRSYFMFHIEVPGTESNGRFYYILKLCLVFH